MQLLRHHLRRLAPWLIALHLMALLAPTVHAGLVDAESLLDAASDRDRISRILDRDDVQAHLVAHGVDPASAQARVSAMSDADAARLAQDLERAPAGAGLVEVILIVFLVWAVGHATDWGQIFMNEPAEGG